MKSNGYKEHYRISGGKQVEPDLSPYDETAYAYSGTLNWFFHLTINFRLLPRTMNAANANGLYYPRAAYCY